MRRSLMRACGRARSRLGAERAYTLPELLIAMLVLSVVMTAIVNLFVSAQHANDDMNKRFQAQQQVLFALDTLRSEVHCAASVSPTTGTVQSITLTISTSTNTNCPTSGSVTWCTIANGTKWDLWRTPGSTCTSTGGVKKASYLIVDHAFTPVAGSSSSLPYVTVNFQVNVKRASGAGTYKLADSIVLRNGTRS